VTSIPGGSFVFAPFYSIRFLLDEKRLTGINDGDADAIFLKFQPQGIEKAGHGMLLAT